MADLVERISKDEIKAILDYDPETGDFVWLARPRSAFKNETRWKIWQTRYLGTKAGTVSQQGYRVITIAGRKHFAHHLAWIFMMGIQVGFPDYEIDHIDHDRLNNSWRNIRRTTRLGNARNLPRRHASKRPYPGIYRNAHRAKWIATIGNGGQKLYIGEYDTLNEAVIARKREERKIGYHENHAAAIRALSQGEQG